MEHSSFLRRCTNWCVPRWLILAQRELSQGARAWVCTEVFVLSYYSTSSGVFQSALWFCLSIQHPRSSSPCVRVPMPVVSLYLHLLSSDSNSLPNWFLYLKAVLALTMMPSFARIFWSSIPVDSSSFVICWSMICFTFGGIFEAWPLPGLREIVPVTWYRFRNFYTPILLALCPSLYK